MIRIRTALPLALAKLDPRTLWRNPVMLVVEAGAVFTTVLAIADPGALAWIVTGWLWLTVLFANLAEAVAEGRGKAQADTLRRAKRETMARRLVSWQSGADSPVIADSSTDATPSTTSPSPGMTWPASTTT